MNEPLPKAETGIPFLVIGNVRSQRIDFAGSRFVPLRDIMKHLIRSAVPEVATFSTRWLDRMEYPLSSETINRSAFNGTSAF
jgi:hypothetical protein